MKTDVLIIGGGLAGAATAYFLAREGVDVLVADQFEFNTQASGSNSGSLHIQIPHDMFLLEGEDWAHRFAPVIPLLIESTKLWNAVGREIDTDLGIRITGGLLVARTERQMRDIRRKVAIERQCGVNIELVGRRDIRSLAPYVAEDAVGGAFCPDEGSADPLRATRGLVTAAMRHGARIRQFTRILDLDVVDDGFVAGTAAGPIRAGRIVNCAGAGAGRIAGMLGIRLPVEGHPIQVSVTEPVQPLVSHLVYAAEDRLTLKQMKNGTFIIGGGWPSTIRRSDGRLVVNLRSLRDNLRIALGVVPALADVHLVRSWPATVNGTADWLPILGEVPGYPGFYMNMFPWMGFTGGPIAAMTVANQLLGRSSGISLEQFSASRYA